MRTNFLLASLLLSTSIVHGFTPTTSTLGALLVRSRDVSSKNPTSCLTSCTTILLDQDYDNDLSIHQHNCRRSNHNRRRKTYLFFQNRNSFGNHRRHQSEHRHAHAAAMEPVPLPNSSDPFVILSISHNASKDEIKRAYRDLAMRYHPDTWIKASSTEEEKQRANDDFARINDAYARIMDNLNKQEQFGGGGMGTMSTNQASASAVANGWNHNMPKTNPNQQPQPQYPGERSKEGSQTKSSAGTNWSKAQQAYTHYGEDFHSKYASSVGGSGSAATFNTGDRQRSQKRQEELKQHYENLSSNRDKYKKYGGTSSTMGFYEAYNETETKSNEGYHVHVKNQNKKVRRGVVNPGTSNFSGGVNPGVNGVKYHANPAVNHNVHENIGVNYGGNQQQQRQPIHRQQPASGRRQYGPVNRQQQHKQKPLHVQQPINRGQGLDHVGEYTYYDEGVNGQRQQQFQRQQPMNGQRQHVNGQYHQPEQAYNNQDTYTSRPGHTMQNIRNAEFNMNGIQQHDHRSRKNAKYRRQQQVNHANGPIHNVPRQQHPDQQYYQQQQQQLSQYPQRNRQGVPYNSQHVQTQAPIPQYQEHPQQQHQSSKYAQRPGYVSANSISSGQVSARSYANIAHAQPQNTNVRQDLRLDVSQVAQQQTQHYHTPQPPPYTPTPHHRISQPSTYPPQSHQRNNDNEVSFEFKRNVYGGTSSDAQRKEKQKSSFSRYSGTDLDNDFARRVRATASYAPQSKYAGQGYGGTSTDAVTNTALGRDAGNKKVTIRRTIIDIEPGKHGGTSADAMKRNKAPANKTVAPANTKVGYTVQADDVKKSRVARPSSFTHQGFGGTSSPYRENEDNVKQSKASKTPVAPEGSRQQQKSIPDERRYGDFFDAGNFHDKWNTSNPDPAEQANRPLTAKRGYAERVSVEEEQRRYNEAVLEEAKRRAAQLTAKMKAEEEKKKQKQQVSHIGSIEAGLSLAINAVTSLFGNNDKRQAEATQTPVKSIQFSPYEACTMIEMHQRDPTKDQEKAIEIMLRNRNVPIDRTELLSLYSNYREGRVATNHQW